MSEFNLTTALKAVKARRAEMGNEPEKPSRGMLDPNSPQQRIARARTLEANVLEQLEFLKGESDSEVKQLRMASLFDRLGELAAERGDYKYAASVSISPERRAHYQNIVKAIKDDQTCDCPPDVIVDRANQREYRSPAIMTVDTIVSPTGGQLSLDMCRKCNLLNAR